MSFICIHMKGYHDIILIEANCKKCAVISILGYIFICTFPKDWVIPTELLRVAIYLCLSTWKQWINYGVGMKEEFHLFVCIICTVQNFYNAYEKIFGVVIQIQDIILKFSSLLHIESCSTNKLNKSLQIIDDPWYLIFKMRIIIVIV